jgi:hypothetical protein
MADVVTLVAILACTPPSAMPDFRATGAFCGAIKAGVGVRGGGGR